MTVTVPSTCIIIYHQATYYTHIHIISISYNITYRYPVIAFLFDRPASCMGLLQILYTLFSPAHFIITVQYV